MPLQAQILASAQSLPQARFPLRLFRWCIFPWWITFFRFGRRAKFCAGSARASIRPRQFVGRYRFLGPACRAPRETSPFDAVQLATFRTIGPFIHVFCWQRLSFPFATLLFSFFRLQSGYDVGLSLLGEAPCHKWYSGGVVASEYHFTFFFVLKQLLVTLFAIIFRFRTWSLSCRLP